MKIDQNPFSLYDFLGYLIPGLFFTYATMFIFKFDFFNPSLQLSINLSIDDYFIVVVLSYIVGHILSYLSSITVELYSIWTLDYPSRYLLDLKYQYPGFWRRVFHDRSPIIILIKIAIVISIFPVFIIDVLIRNIIKTPKLLGKPMDKLTITLVKEKIPQYLKDNFTIDKDFLPLSKKENDFFNLIYHKDLESCGMHVSKLQNYVALYGFTRTICYSLILLIWLIVLRGIGGSFSINVCIAIIILTILSGILYLDFNKFYRKFSQEAFFAFLSINKNT